MNQHEINRLKQHYLDDEQLQSARTQQRLAESQQRQQEQRDSATDARRRLIERLEAGGAK